MAQKIKTKPSQQLKTKFRFVVLNDETFEEKFSLTLTRRNVWVFLSVAAFTVVFITASAIIYTPLKYFIPGFGDYNYRSQLIKLQFETDSLQQAMQSRELWLQNVMDVATGNIDSTKPEMDPGTETDKSKIKLNAVSDEDKALRKQVEEEESFQLSKNAGVSGAVVTEVKQMHLIAPVEGYVTDEHDKQAEHFGIDIAAKPDAPVKATLDGKVIATGYTLETGYYLTVQHSSSLVSIYKHNAKLLKKDGEAVKAGEVIAFVGNSGEYTSGPHLHFELWYEGKSLNPRDYILF